MVPLPPKNDSRSKIVLAIALLLSVFGSTGYSGYAPAKQVRADQTECVWEGKPKERAALISPTTFVPAHPAAGLHSGSARPTACLPVHSRLFAARIRALNAQSLAIRRPVIFRPDTTFPQLPDADPFAAAG